MRVIAIFLQRAISEASEEMLLQFCLPPAAAGRTGPGTHQFTAHDTTTGCVRANQPQPYRASTAEWLRGAHLPSKTMWGWSHHSWTAEWGRPLCHRPQHGSSRPIRSRRDSRQRARPPPKIPSASRAPLAYIPKSPPKSPGPPVHLLLSSRSRCSSGVPEAWRR
jgi:hypothetical protein